jgi:hypothetical protein
MTINIDLPNREWTPRPHQMPLWLYLNNGGKRAIAVWHRRAGKDDVCLHWCMKALWLRPGNYWHMLPEFEQARRAIWTAINPHTGRRRIDEAFPEQLRENTNDSTMFIRFKNGSTWSCQGSDRYNAAMGASPAGITFSEYALSNPSAWAYFRPMLEENGGWAVFITTPRGRNHAYDMLNYARQQPAWFAETLTARDTEALSQAELDQALKEYVSIYGIEAGQAIFDQELMVSFNAAVLGSYYAAEMTDVRKEGRVLDIEPDLDRPISRAWDLGVRDDTCVVWFQARGSQLLILDVMAGSGNGVEYYRDEIFKRHEARGWIHGDDYVPHDAKILEWGSGRTRVETMRTLGLSPLLVPRAELEDGINATRRTLPLCVFHPRCEPLLAALEQYQREWDDDKKAFKLNPLHNWTSHFADAMRYLAQGWKPAPKRVIKVLQPAGFTLPPPPDTPRRGIRL